MFTQRKFNLKNINELISNVISPLAKKVGFTNIKLLQDWEFIIADNLRGFTFPEKIVINNFGGTLHLCVDAKKVLQVQHSMTEIIDKVNDYFGYMAITNIFIKQRHDQKKNKLNNKILSKQNFDSIDEVDLEKSLKKFCKSCLEFESKQN